MFGTVEQMIKDMEHGVYDFTVNGECSQCGACCSAMLPMTNKELSDLKKYVRIHHIKPITHFAPTVDPLFDLSCPFRSDKEKKCLVYEVRPEICKEFQCNKPKEHIRPNMSKPIEDYEIINLRAVKWS